MIARVLASLVFTGLLVLHGSGLQPAARQASGDRESAYRANNVGIAFLEQFDYDAAAASFTQALKVDDSLGIARFNLALALFYANNADASLVEARAAAERIPDSPQPHYLLGLLARSQNRAEDAVGEFTRVLERDPDDVGAKVNLGQVYLQERKYDEALKLLREAFASEPFNVTAAYNLATALGRSGAQQEARTAMERFQKLRDSSYGFTYSQTYLAQGKYAEALASTGAEAELVNQAAPAASFVDATSTFLPGRRAGEFVPAAGAAAAAALSGHVTLFDADGDGDLDLAEAGAAGLRLYRNAAGLLKEEAGLAPPQTDGGGVPIAAVAADHDNDGRIDLFLLRYGGNRLLRQQADGRFEDVTAAAGIAGSPRLARSAALVDVDHDGDLDIFIVGYQEGASAGGAGQEQTGPALNQLLRNNGDGTFADVTAPSGVSGAGGPGIAVVPTDFDNRRDMDLLVVQRGRAPTLFQNVRDGSFRDAAPDVRLPPAASYSSVAAGDVNKDGYTDFFFGRSDGPGTLALSDGSGRFASSPAPAGSAGAIASQFVDYDNDGLLDLVVVAERSPHLFRNLGGRWAEVAINGLESGAAAYQSMAVGDLDGDGDEDAVVSLRNGELRAWRNDAGSASHSLQVKLTGRVSNRGGVGSKNRPPCGQPASTSGVVGSDARRRAGGSSLRAGNPRRGGRRPGALAIGHAADGS